MQRIIRACGLVAVAMLAACHHRPAGAPAPQDAPPLASFASLRIVVTPTAFVHATDSLGWIASLGGTRATARAMDSVLAVALDARGLTPRWILPPALVHSWEHNRTYATDPYQLTADALRLPTFQTGSRYADPLASQLRTMIALEEDTRYVLLPVALRFEPAAGGGRAVIRVALLDARATDARWVADVRGDAAPSAGAALTSAAAKLANYFALP